MFTRVAIQAEHPGWRHPGHRVLHRAHHGDPGRKWRAVDHHDVHIQCLRGVQFGLGELSPLFLVTSTSMRYRWSSPYSSS